MKYVVLPAGLHPTTYYHEMHVGYVAGMLVDAGVCVEYMGESSDDLYGNCVYPIIIDGERCWFDYSDFIDTALLALEDRPSFKYSFQPLPKGNKRRIYPFPHASVYDWRAFRDAQASVRYRAEGFVIASHGLSCSPEARARRQGLMNMVQSLYGKRALVHRASSQSQFWSWVSGALVAVLLPGSADNLPTRAVHQYLGLGCCVISPRLMNIMPFYKEWVPGVHYLMCNQDLSDVPALIQWCEQNPEKAIQIGMNAKGVFDDFLTPRATVKWMAQCLKGRA
jgi:hypothetical protein